MSSIIQFQRDAELFAILESTIQKVAQANNIKNVNAINIHLSKNSGVIKFSINPEEAAEKLQFLKENVAQPQDYKELRTEIALEMNNLTQQLLWASGEEQPAIQQKLQQLDELRTSTFETPDDAAKAHEQLRGWQNPDPNFKPMEKRETEKSEKGWGYNSGGRWVGGPDEESAHKKSPVAPSPTSFQENPAYEKLKNKTPINIPDGRQTFKSSDDNSKKEYSMKINSNTVVVAKGSQEYAEFEAIVTKIAQENNLNDIKGVSIALSKNAGAIKFSLQSENEEEENEENEEKSAETTAAEKEKIDRY